MAHPKRKISKSRRDKRRTHIKLEAPTLTTDKQTDAPKINHRASLVKEDGKKVFYYNGRKFD
jgi:large subunit ribosomal protein L32